jgi:hypothetical protein
VPCFPLQPGGRLTATTQPQLQLKFIDTMIHVWKLADIEQVMSWSHVDGSSSSACVHSHRLVTDHTGSSHASGPAYSRNCIDAVFSCKTVLPCCRTGVTGIVHAAWLLHCPMTLLCTTCLSW